MGIDYQWDIARQTRTFQCQRQKCHNSPFKNELIVDHFPINVPPILYQFLRREVNKAFVEVEGEKVNRGGGYKLKVTLSQGKNFW